MVRPPSSSWSGPHGQEEAGDLASGGRVRRPVGRIDPGSAPAAPRVRFGWALAARPEAVLHVRPVSGGRLAYGAEPTRHSGSGSAFACRPLIAPRGHSAGQILAVSKHSPRWIGS